MTKKRKPPAEPLTRPEEERRQRFSWDGDDILHLEIDGQNVRSAPKPTR
jgi:hypothetical protein